MKHRPARDAKQTRTFAILSTKRMHALAVPNWPTIQTSWNSSCKCHTDYHTNVQRSTGLYFCRGRRHCSETEKLNFGDCEKPASVTSSFHVTSVIVANCARSACARDLTLKVLRQCCRRSTDFSTMKPKLHA